MLKLTRTGIGLLTRQYRSVLHKCWLINVGLWQAMGDAVSKAVSVPARLIASLLSGGALNGEAFSVLDEILLSRLFERKLATLTAIGLTIAAATMPGEAEAGLLCYNSSDGTVKYTVSDTCPVGTPTKLISLGAIDSTATTGAYSTALGYSAQATQNYATALGSEAYATGIGSTAVGSGAQATQNYATALGNVAKATKSFATALGASAQAYGNYSMAQGYRAYTGYKTTPTADSSEPTTTPEYALAIGTYAGALTNRSIAIGTEAKAGQEQEISTYTNAVAIGSYAQATSHYSVALGSNAQATGANSTALGNVAKATKSFATALGASAQATEDYAMALGYNAQATGNSSQALGKEAQATGKNSIAIGYQSVANEANTVSFGRLGADKATLDQMQADIDGGMTQSEFVTKYAAQYSQASALYMLYKNLHRSWETAVEQTKIAEITHRITNVADGTNEHDAVTLGQLQNNYYRKLMKKDENLIKTANDNNKNDKNLDTFII